MSRRNFGMRHRDDFDTQWRVPGWLAVVITAAWGCAILALAIYLRVTGHV